jgi:hypothetical protein
MSGCATITYCSLGFNGLGCVGMGQRLS